jgi:hypothetical protein
MIFPQIGGSADELTKDVEARECAPKPSVYRRRSESDSRKENAVR